MCFGAADTDARVGNDAACQAVGHQRHRDPKISGPPIEFIEPKAGIVGNTRQTDFGEDFSFLKRGRHDAMEKII